MGHTCGRVLAAAALAGAATLALAGPARAETRAAATAEASANNMYATVLGVPATLPIGGTLDLTEELRWDSYFPIQITGLGVSMWSSVAGTAPTQGIDVLWQDPETGAWRQSDTVDDADGSWAITEPDKLLIVPPKGTLDVHLKITMGAAAAVGTEHLDAGQFDYANTLSGALLRGSTISHPAQAQFQFGADLAGGFGGPTEPPTPTGPAAIATTAPPGPTPAATGSAPSSAAALPVAVVGGPHRSGAGTDGASPAAPSPPHRTAPPDTITEANIVLRGPEAASVFGAVAVLLAFLTGSALVIVRARRPGEPAAGATGPSTEPPDSTD
jgi:hypothetical protein